MADYNKLLNISTRDSFILKRKQQKKTNTPSIVPQVI